MFPSVVIERTSRALTFCFPFIYFFLVNSLMCHLPYSVYDLSSGRCCFLFDLSRLLFCCLVYPFFFGGILWFLSLCRCLFGGFSFLSHRTERVSFKLSSFLEIFLVFNRFAKCFQPFSVVYVFLLHRHSSDSFFRDLVFYYFSEGYSCTFCAAILTFNLL